jgi:tetratricopeptide (TPR) repeat protein
VARRGARLVLDAGPPPPAGPGVPAAVRAREHPFDQDRWRDDGPVDGETPAGGAWGRRRRPAEPELALPAEVWAELAGAVGRARGARLAERLEAASRAYARDRYAEALRITKALVDQVPESASVQELHGLVCYRTGRFRQAVRHLEAARRLAGQDPAQLPVIMDCHRALGHHRRVEALWQELRAASPHPDLLAEGRLVVAAGRADRGELSAAVEILEQAGAGRNRRHPAERHLRQWYVLADLFERAGDLARARELFGRVAEADPGLADVTSRLVGLGRGRPRPAGAGRRRAGGPGS